MTLLGCLLNFDTNSSLFDRLSAVDPYFSGGRFYDHVLFFGILQVVNFGSDSRYDPLGI